MVAATGAVMSAVTTGAAGAAKPAATTAAIDDATQGAAGDFVQMIAELLGGAPMQAATPANTTTTTGTSASSDEQSGDETKKPADDSALTDMLALGMTLPFTPAPQAQTAATPAAQASATNNAALDALSGDGKSAGSNTNLDALRLQQLSKMLSKDSTAAAGSTDKNADGEFSVAALFGKNETTQAATADKSTDLLGKLEQATDTGAATTKQTTQHPAADQLQQANAFIAKQSDNVADQRQQLTIHSRVGSHEWSTELGNKLTLMSTQNTQSASLQITPDHLGPVEVKIEVNQGQTSVWFTADQAETRTALEQSLPKLREMFAAQGMSLTDAGVFGQRSQQQQQQQQQAPSSFGSGGSNVQVEELSVSQVAASRSLSLGMLDTYA